MAGDRLWPAGSGAGFLTLAVGSGPEETVKPQLGSGGPRGVDAPRDSFRCVRSGAGLINVGPEGMRGVGVDVPKTFVISVARTPWVYQWIERQ